MTRVLSTVNALPTTNADGFGLRASGVDTDSGDAIDLLDLAPDLVEHAGFVAALGERVARFAGVRHASYVHLRRLDRPSPDRLELVSDFTPGWRLSELLEASMAANIGIDVTIVIGVLRQLLPAVALYGRHNRDAAIGALGVERLIVTPQARVVIAEHAFGPALEKLNLGRERLWRDRRVSMPPSAGLPRANQRADAHALGVVALTLLLGRPLELDEFPTQLQALAEGAAESRDGETVPLSASFAGWLARTLQFDVRTAFQSPSEAQLAFESVLASDRAYVTSTTNLEQWVATVGATIDASRTPDAPAPPSLPPIIVVAPLEASGAPEPSLPTASEPARASEVTSASEARSTAVIRVPMMALGAVIFLLLLTVGWLWTRETGAPAAGEGELVVESRPPGARVSVDGKERGVTPTTVRLESGAHVLEVQIGKSEPRVIPLMIRAGVQTAQYVELQER